MAVITAKTLVLRGVSVRFDRKVVGMRLGTGMAGQQNSALSFSLRHLPSGCPQAEQTPSTWHDHADHLGVDGVAYRAGRPGSGAGVPVRRSPASIAGGTVLWEGSLAEGGPNPSAARTNPTGIWCWSASEMALLQRSMSLQADLLASGSRPDAKQVRKNAGTKRARPTPVRGTTAASMRGK